MCCNNCRRQPKNMILAGMWFSGEKPPMQLYLKPIVEELSTLETSGSPQVKLISLLKNINIICMS